MRIRKSNAAVLSLALVVMSCTSTTDEAEEATTTVATETSVDDSVAVDSSGAVDRDATEDDEPDDLVAEDTDDPADDGAPATTEPDDADADPDVDPETDELAEANPAVLAAEDLGDGWELYFGDTNTLEPADLTFPDCDTSPPAVGLTGPLTFYQNEALGDFTQMIFDSEAATIDEWFATVERVVDCGEVTENGSPSVYSYEPLSSDLGADDVLSLRAVELDAGGQPATGGLLVFARFGDTLMLGVTTFGLQVADLDADWVGAQLRLSAEKAGLI